MTVPTISSRGFKPPTEGLRCAVLAHVADVRRRTGEGIEYIRSPNVGMVCGTDVVTGNLYRADGLSVVSFSGCVRLPDRVQGVVLMRRFPSALLAARWFDAQVQALGNM